MIQTVKVDLGERSYDILVGENLISGAMLALDPIVNGKKCHVITDSNVGPLYFDAVAAALTSAKASGVSQSVVPAGEQNKTLESIGGFCSDMVTAGLDRKSMVVALGGGVPGDMAGFSAACYMRGIDFIQVPTSLLAMVDSSVGGKTGVDLPAGKNLVGAFWQPRLVLIDTSVLNTLPDREVRCGLAEIVKYGVIKDEEFFSKLEQSIDLLNSLDLEFYADIIAHCCRIKAEVVSCDEKESGLRAILNYGHTFGHAIEAVTNFSIGHGEGVAIGMCMAADLAVNLGMMTASAANRQEKLLTALKLPTRINGCDPDAVVAAMFKDKKTSNGKVVFILPLGIGMVSIEKGVDMEMVRQTVGGRCD